MINIEKNELETVKSILRKYFPKCEIRVFGSRITENYKKYSDLDIAVVGGEKLDIKLLNRAIEAFEYSELPFRIDVMDYNRLEESFKRSIDRGYEILKI